MNEQMWDEGVGFIDLWEEDYIHERTCFDLLTVEHVGTI